VLLLNLLNARLLVSPLAREPLLELGSLRLRLRRAEPRVSLVLQRLRGVHHLQHVLMVRAVQRLELGLRHLKSRARC